MSNDPNKRAPNPGMMLSGGGDGRLTVGDVRDAIHDLDYDVEIIFGGTMLGANLSFCRFKWRGDKLLQMELNEDFPGPGKYSITIPDDG
jgi:hypothetical protein